ncbi:unnamed protein product [marine sediment metagenome]|uniref:Uncharacterized protein n=1 Tax=marine sediment metagenome TaxID=412755 RepID=X1R7Y1_9ZZZZ
MDISKARRLVELEKEGRKILLTLWDGNLISSCVEENEKKYCETCHCNDEICQEYIDHLKAQGYGATEVKLGKLELEESLPKFLEERVGVAKIEPVPETEVIEHADIEAAEAVPGSPGELQPGESGDSGPEIS